jgi:hypothetical protein
VSDPENGKTRIARRRRPTSRHRRNRLIRKWLKAGATLLLIACVSAVAMQYVIPLFTSREAGLRTVQLNRLNSEQVAKVNEILAHTQASRPVYPYSVVPGGVEDVKGLKWAAEHDPVVAAHYAGFDYAKAQVVRLTLNRTVYVSYRIGNRIYWTRHRVTLHKGETVITDGTMTARTRCANRVEETPQQEASPNEPTPEKMDQPARNGEGTAMASPPVTFQTALLNRPQAPGVGPMGPLVLYDPLGGASFTPLSPPPLPIEGVCGPKKKGTGGTTGTGGGKKKVGSCGTTGTVPEPGTWLLLATGLAGILFLALPKMFPGFRLSFQLPNRVE